MDQKQLKQAFRPAVLLIAGLLLLTAAPGSAGPNEDYVAGGIIVAKGDALATPASGPTAADTGAVLCSQSGPDTGGACIDFGTSDSNYVEVIDSAHGPDVAFQVCIDNDGDGNCGTPPFFTCGDDIFFSHDDAGNFFNPLGPLPTGFRSGCPGGPHPGYVVLLCEGFHQPGGENGTAHLHPATTGSVSLAASGSGYGDFCGGDSEEEQQTKRYEIVP